jgi:hypothetical protein
MKMSKSDKQNRNGQRKGSETKLELGDDVDALFRLPLAEFTGARNTLAAQYKKSGRGDEAALVKVLAKPTISAWAVNQLYWNHRKAFDRLLASAERFHKAQASAARVANMREALNERREALTDLSDLATSLLRDAGHNPSLDMIHRITTTLESMSVYASRSDAPRPGRLTHDVDPPGFEALASWAPGAGTTRPTEKPARLTPSQKSSRVVTKTRLKVATDDDVRRAEETRKTNIAAAKVSVQAARRSLTEARARAQSLEAAQKKADAEAKKADQQMRAAEESLEKAKAASKNAAGRAQSVAGEVEEAASAVEDAELTVERASRELEKLFGDSSGR